MWIRVATGASRERNASIFYVRLGIRDGCVALRAAHHCVRAAQLEFRCGVIETGGWFPRVRAVTFGAVRAKLTPMLILMAAGTSAGEAKVGVVQIFCLHLHLRACCGRDVSRLVALFAFQSCVCAGQRKSRLFVIHGLAARLPAN